MADTTQNLPRPLLPERPLDRRGRITNSTKRAVAVALVALAMPLLAPAQQNVQAPPQGELPAGKMVDGYIVQQSVEFGGRITDVNGNHQVYDTLINLRDGPRLLGQELIMRSPTRDHGIFDSLYLSSFGYGGDPNDMTRLRIEKGRWYDFVGLYRRDENFFDFNVFANPLNLNPGIGAALKSAPNPAFPATSPIPWLFDPRSMPWFANSPHLQDTVRNMGDFNLTLFPDSKVRIRLGYARNDTQGRLDTTLETPIRSIISEHDRWRSDRYQFGIDFRPIKRTTISFDQFFEHDKVDPNFFDNNLSFFDTATGTPIDIGVLFPPSGCTITPGVTFVGTNFNPAGCNIGLFSFNRSGRVRSDIPTSQLSFASNYFRKLDITGSGTYSSGESEFLSYQEFINGSGTGKAPTLITGQTHTDRVSGNADLGLTYHFTPHWSASDKFRWLSWRDPGNFDQINNTCTGLTGPQLTLATAGCTPNPLTSDFFETLIASRIFVNTAKVNYQTRRFGGYVGYRYQRRELTGAPTGESLTLNSYYLKENGAEPAPPDVPPLLPGLTTMKNTTRINEHTALAGVMLRPTSAWRINADVELLSADNSFTNIAPRHQQRVRFNTVYKVNRWASVNGSVHFVETRNDFATHINSDSTVFAPFSPPPGDPSSNPNLFPTNSVAFPAGVVDPAYGHKDHWRYFTLGASLNPDPRFSLDFGWTYLDTLFNSATCVPVGARSSAAGPPNTVILPGTNPPVPGILPGLCVTPNSSAPGTTQDVPLILNYQERTNTGFFVLTVRPVHRVTLNFGYEITSTAGHNRWLLPGGADGNGELQVLSDVFGNSPPLPGNPTAPCPAASIPATGGCAFAGPFADAPLSQALNWHKPYAGIAVDICKNVTFKGMYAYYDYNEKETAGLPIVNQPRDFHANTGTLSLRYAF